MALAALLSSACSTTESMLAESDVPVPDGLETIRSAGIRRTQGTLTGGTFILAGPVDDAGGLLEQTTKRYLGAGWEVFESTAGLDKAVATYRKSGRTVRIEITRRALEPDMSSATIEVREGAAPSAGA